MDWNDVGGFGTYYDVDANLDSGVATIRKITVRHVSTYSGRQEAKVVIEQLVGWVSGSSWDRNMYQESAIHLVNAFLASTKVQTDLAGQRGEPQDNIGSEVRALSRASTSLKGMIAVLEVRVRTPKAALDSAFFSDVVRGQILADAPTLVVMTRENMQVILNASGKRLEDCEGECEVDTGRRVGADFVVSGDLLKSGALLKLSLKLHATASGNLVSTAIASGATPEALETETRRAVDTLLSHVPGP
jgi:hypothetical protein